MSNVVPLQQPLSQVVDGVTVPDFITRVHISKMNDAQLDEMVEQIRARRQTPVLVYKQSQADHHAINEAKVRAKVDKKEEQIVKQIAAVDTQLEKLEKFINELRGLRIQAGLEVI